jgi:predicted ABC-type ATPase
MRKNETSNGKKGGLLKGKPHYDKNGKPLGGIKAIVTDTNTPVELEGGEVIINKEASKKYWKELSRINQSAGNGVPIKNPNAGADEDPEEYKEGGRIIDFNPNHLPNKRILTYAKNIKSKYPKVWDLGGNIFGNEAFKNLQRVSERGYWLESEKWMYIKWRSFVARHTHDFRIKGVIAMLKWVDKVDRGWDYMKNLIEAEIEKKYPSKMEKGGNVENANDYLENKYPKSNVKNVKFEDLPEIFVRVRMPRIKNGKYLPSTNHVTNEKERGISVFTARYSPNSGFIFVDLEDAEGYEDESGYSIKNTFNSLSNEKNDIYLVEGEVIKGKPSFIESYNGKLIDVTQPFSRGADGERLLNTNKIKIIGKLNPSKIVASKDYYKDYLFQDNITSFDGKNLKKYPQYEKGGSVVTYKNKFNKKYGFGINDSHSLTEIAKITKIKLSALQDIYDKGIGAYKTNPESVRPNVKSKEQWAMARVYSAVMGGKASIVDRNELSRGKMGKGGLIAPNGKKSNLTPEQYKLVRTKDFKDWFGDWENDPENSSKVVDENGEPKVVYHGSSRIFTKFIEEKYLGSEADSLTWFTENYETAKSYGSSIIYPCFLKIIHPLESLSGTPEGSILDDNKKGKKTDGFISFGGVFREIHYAVAKSNQIKLATIPAIKKSLKNKNQERANKLFGQVGNITFDSNNSDIRYEKGGLIAPNGKKSNLTPEQYDLVRSKPFKDWFGDWENDPENASKILDENGEPMIVYHGSRTRFNEFDISKGGESNTLAKVGFWLTPLYKFAQNFSENAWWGKEDAIIYSLFLNIRNPKIYVSDENKIFGDSYELFKTDIYKFAGKTELDANIGGIGMMLNNEKETIIGFRELLKNENYDGIIIEKTKYDKRVAGGLNDQFVALYPNQLKLADGNNKTFDNNNSDIRFANGGLIAPNGKSSNLTLEQYNLVRSKAFKDWFGDWENDPENASKILDENGEPLMCFHGSPNKFNEFDYGSIGSNNDNGYYGRGFYFTFQKEFKNIKYAINEASYYGSNVSAFYIKSLKPFDFESLEMYKGERINYIGANSLVFLYNIAKLFPHLAKEITIDKYTYNSITDENKITNVPIIILIDLVDKYSKELIIKTTVNNFDKEVSFGYVKSEIVKYDYTETGGTKGEYESIDDLGRLDNNISEQEKEILFIDIAIKKYDRLTIDYNPEGFMTRYPQITDAIKKHYDSILQSTYGDELVVFESNQIKLADGTNTTFNNDNNDFRFAKGGELSKGINAEKEHLDTAKSLYQHEITPEQSAEKIAKDHLKENPKYYTKLAKIEDDGFTCEIIKNGERQIDADSVEKLTKCINTLPQTKELNSVNGEYTKERKELHKKIINEAKKGVTCITKDKPIAVLMGGSPASGKTTFLKKYRPYLLQNNLFKVDADEVRAKLPEYKGWNASQTHKETSEIVKTLISDRTIGIPCLFDFIYDGTMTGVEKYESLINFLEKEGYEIFIVFMGNISEEVVKERALKRYQNNGRFVPMEVIEDFFNTGEKTLNKLKSKVDGYIVVDASSPNYEIIEQGGKKLPNKRIYEELGDPIKLSKGGILNNQQDLNVINEMSNGGNVDGSLLQEGKKYKVENYKFSGQLSGSLVNYFKRLKKKQFQVYLVDTDKKEYAIDVVNTKTRDYWVVKFDEIQLNEASFNQAYKLKEELQVSKIYKTDDFVFRFPEIIDSLGDKFKVFENKRVVDKFIYGLEKVNYNGSAYWSVSKENIRSKIAEMPKPIDDNSTSSTNPTSLTSLTPSIGSFETKFKVGEIYYLDDVVFTNYQVYNFMIDKAISMFKILSIDLEYLIELKSGINVILTPSIKFNELFPRPKFKNKELINLENYQILGYNKSKRIRQEKIDKVDIYDNSFYEYSLIVDETGEIISVGKNEFVEISSFPKFEYQIGDEIEIDNIDIQQGRITEINLMRSLGYKSYKVVGFLPISNSDDYFYEVVVGNSTPFYYNLIPTKKVGPKNQPTIEPTQTLEDLNLQPAIKKTSKPKPEKINIEMATQNFIENNIVGENTIYTPKFVLLESLIELRELTKIEEKELSNELQKITSDIDNYISNNEKNTKN